MQFPSEDKTVTDEHGQEHLIFAGSPVPDSLKEAYEEDGGEYTEQEEEMAKLAATDAEIEDEQGVPRLIFAGTTVPEVWEEAYEEAGGSFATGPETHKMERGPDTVKSDNENDEEEGNSPSIAAARQQSRRSRRIS